MPGAANPQAFNRYSYVLNNPLKYTDPSGHYHNGAQDSIISDLEARIADGSASMDDLMAWGDHTVQRNNEHNAIGSDPGLQGMVVISGFGIGNARGGTPGSIPTPPPTTNGGGSSGSPTALNPPMPTVPAGVATPPPHLAPTSGGGGGNGSSHSFYQPPFDESGTASKAYAQGAIMVGAGALAMAAGAFIAGVGFEEILLAGRRGDAVGIFLGIETMALGVGGLGFGMVVALDGLSRMGHAIIGCATGALRC